MAINAKIQRQFAEESGHWYTKDGKPMYRIIGKNGKERDTTLRDAREHDLVPSVSTIAQIEAKPQLIRWLVEQGMMACLTLPRVHGEDEQTFMKRALEDSKEQTRKAAERGQYLHGMLESTVSGHTRECTAEDRAYIQPVVDWLHTKFPGYKWYVERSFAARANGAWYGGKIDLHGTHETLPPVTIDYKCKDFKDPDAKKLAYDEHVTQLSAYSRGLNEFGGSHIGHEARCVNLFISSTVPGLFVVKEWTPDEIRQGYRAFCAQLELWNTRKKFA